MLPKEILLSWVFELWIYILNFTFFVYILSKRLLNTDPKRIRIHNTDRNSKKECKN